MFAQVLHTFEALEPLKFCQEFHSRHLLLSFRVMLYKQKYVYISMKVEKHSQTEDNEILEYDISVGHFERLLDIRLSDIGFDLTSHYQFMSSDDLNNKLFNLFFITF